MPNQENEPDKIDNIGSSEIVSEQLYNERTNPSKSKNSKEESDLKDLPEDAQAIMKMMLSSSSFSARSSSPLSSSLSNKIDNTHISKMLDIAEQDNKREYEDTKLARIYNLITLVIILIFLGFITVFLGNKDLSTYQDIIRIIIIFGGGFGAGFGYKSRIK